MPELQFQIEGAEAVPYSAAPLIRLNTRIRSIDPGMRFHNVLLQCQIQIEPARRSYVAGEKELLGDLFGVPSRWSQTLRPLLWTNSTVVVPAFEQEALAEIPLPCSFDFNVATTKYLHGVQDGDVPLCILLSGTAFYATTDRSFQVAKIPWDRELHYRLPVRVWKEMMDAYYPNSAWLILQRNVFDQLHRYKTERGIPTWEQTFEKLMAAAEEAELNRAET